MKVLATRFTIRVLGLGLTGVVVSMILVQPAKAIDIQDFLNRATGQVSNVAPADGDCSQPSKQLSLTSVHTLMAAACTLNSLNLTEKKALEASQGENHFHDWDVINSEEGFVVQGYCSKRVVLNSSGISRVISGQKIELSFLSKDMKKCDPVIKGQIGKRSVRFQFADDKSVMNSDNSFTNDSKRVLARLDIGVDFPKDWLNFTFTSPWMTLGNTPENREIALGDLPRVDFNNVRLHMVGSRSMTAALAMRWDFLISGEEADLRRGLSYDSGKGQNLLIRIANSTDSLSAGFESSEMSASSKVAQNVFYRNGFGVDPLTKTEEAYVTKMRGCSDLIFNGTVFKMSALNIDRCEQRISKFLL